MQESNYPNDFDGSANVKLSSSAENLVCSKELSSNTI